MFCYRTAKLSFSFPEAALLLVSTKNRDLWPNLWPSPTPEVRDSRTSRHSAHVQSQVWQIWLVLVSISLLRSRYLGRHVTTQITAAKETRSQSIVFTKPFKHGMSLDLARGRDSWCWPKGARPLGTRMLNFLKTKGHTRALWYNDFRKSLGKNVCIFLLL